jgi:hypothetical protein
MKLHSSRSSSKSNPTIAKLSSAPLEARKAYSPPLLSSASVILKTTAPHKDPLPTQPARRKLIHSQSFTPVAQALKDSSSQNPNLDPPYSADPAESAKLL